MTDCPHGDYAEICPPCQDGVPLNRLRPGRLHNAPAITAKFPSNCGACDEPIPQGRRIVQSDQGTWIHDDCGDI